MKKYIALALIAVGIASLSACRHHPPRPDDDGPGMSRRDDRGGNRGGYQNGPQRNDQRGPSAGGPQGGPGGR